MWGVGRGEIRFKKRHYKAILIKIMWHGYRYRPANEIKWRAQEQMHTHIDICMTGMTWKVSGGWTIFFINSIQDTCIHMNSK